LVPDNAEELAVLLRGVAGPAMAAFVMFSDVCVVVGALDGTLAWVWMFNDWMFIEEDEAGGGLDVVAADPLADLDAELTSRIQAVIPRLVAWSETAGLGAVARDRLEGLLERGYVCAEDGLYALLAELGVTVRPAAPACDRAATRHLSQWT
jgi:hypothetical protein